jgi:hypothetical protein
VEHLSDIFLQLGHVRKDNFTNLVYYHERKIKNKKKKKKKIKSLARKEDYMSLEKKKVCSNI